MTTVYGVAFLALLVALVLTWRARRHAPRLALILGGLAVVLAVLDLTGVTAGEPAPAGMIAVDAVGIAIGAGIIWTSLTRREPSARAPSGSR